MIRGAGEILGCLRIAAGAAGITIDSAIRDAAGNDVAIETKEYWPTEGLRVHQS
jgi:hypothetical protein